MYLTRDDRTNILIEQIAKAKKLVDVDLISIEAAYHVILEQAIEHPYWKERAQEAVAQMDLPAPVEPPSMFGPSTTQEDLTKTSGYVAPDLAAENAF